MKFSPFRGFWDNGKFTLSRSCGHAMRPKLVYIPRHYILVFHIILQLFWLLPIIHLGWKRPLYLVFLFTCRVQNLWVSCSTYLCKYATDSSKYLFTSERERHHQILAEILEYYPDCMKLDHILSILWWSMKHCFFVEYQIHFLPMAKERAYIASHYVKQYAGSCIPGCEWVIYIYI